MNIFLGMTILWIYPGGVITKLDEFKGSDISGYFLKVKEHTLYVRIFVWDAKISNIFWVCLISMIFLIFLLVNSTCWVQAYVSRKK